MAPDSDERRDLGVVRMAFMSTKTTGGGSMYYSNIFESLSNIKAWHVVAKGPVLGFGMNVKSSSWAKQFPRLCRLMTCIRSGFLRQVTGWGIEGEDFRDAVLIVLVAEQIA